MARPDGKAQCRHCTNHYRELKDGSLVAHFDWATHRWCPGGRAPTAHQKATRKPKGSIRPWRG